VKIIKEWAIEIAAKNNKKQIVLGVVGLIIS
jgi:hypothetical protein